MIVGIGTDIIEIARIEQISAKAGLPKFAKKILTDAEILALSEVSAAKLAKRFAAKEAISKAFGTGIGAKLAFHDIEIFNDESGKPTAHIKKHGDLKIHLSISDERTHAIAFAVIES